MNEQKYETGKIDEVPFLKFGKGPTKIILFPPTSELIVPLAKFPEQSYFLYSKIFPIDVEVIVFGYPENLPEGTNYETIADLFAEKISKNLEKSIIVGASYGAGVAQVFAAKYPELTQKLVCLLGGYGPSLDTGMKFVREMLKNAEMGEHYKVAKTLAQLWESPLFKIIIALRNFKNRKKLPEMWGSMSNLIVAYKDVIDNPFRSKVFLSKIQAPTYVIGGTEDLTGSREIYEETAEIIPNCELTLFEGAGHYVILEKKKEFNLLFDKVLKSTTTPNKTEKKIIKDKKVPKEIDIVIKSTIAWIALTILVCIIYYQISDFSINLADGTLFVQGFGFLLADLMSIISLIKLYQNYKIEKKNNTKILIAYFFFTAIVGILQIFLAFFVFTKAEEMNNILKIVTALNIPPLLYCFTLFLIGVFYSDMSKNKIKLIKIHLGSFTILGWIFFMFKGIEITNDIGLKIIGLWALLIEIVVFTLLAIKSFGIRNRVTSENHKRGFLYIGLSGIINVCAWLSTFVDFILIGESLFIGTLTALLYMVGYFLLYQGFILIKKE